MKFLRFTFLAVVVLGLALSTMGFTASLSVTGIGGCQNGPYTYNKDDRGGHDGGVCRDADGEPAVDDCCCFVASSSGLSHEEITTLRHVRDWMLNNVPGFTVVNDYYHTDLGPKTANYLRTHDWARNLSHNILQPISQAFGLFVK